MSSGNLSRLRSYFIISFRKALKRRGFWSRGLLCWLIGLIVLSNDELNSYDQRFQLRSQQKVSDKIVLILLKQEDFSKLYDFRTNSLLNLHEISDITDSFFWDKNLWLKLLKKLQSQNPRSIGVSLYFGENIGNLKLTEDEERIFKNPKIFWATSINQLERTLIPTFVSKNQANFGSNELTRDDDGVVRRHFPVKSDMAHLVEKISHKKFPAAGSGLSINFRGNNKIFETYLLSEVINDNIPNKALENKIILIGPESTLNSQFLTPVGPLSRLEILAQLTDNLIENRWIQRLPFMVYAFGCLLIVLLALFIMIQYPQSVALILFIWIGTLLVALSAWVFDSFYIWLPAFSPFILLATTWVVFVGYQATKIETRNFQLRQEQKYLQELEQLKNNFISLISHDLKTPIAKIQAIVDRMLSQNPGAFTSDLQTLKSSSEELYRYIQSILNLLRVESRDFKLHLEIADINEIIEEALKQLQPLAHEKNIHVKLELEPMFSIEFDITLIKEVLINLIENAIKYTPNGGIIKISSQEIENEIRVRIQDNGIGIPPEEVEEVWKKFVRGKDQDLKTKGTGLGLYLVKYFIELHGGKVQLDSILNQGSTVSFTLPLTDATNLSSISEVNI